MPPLAKLFELSAPERHELLRAAVLLPITGLALRMRGMQGVRITTPVRQSIQSHPSLTAAQVARLVAAAARWSPWRTPCMVRSLVLQRLLARRGIASELRFGVRKAGGQLEAHAWVEHLGKPLAEPHGVADDYAPFDPLPGESRS